MDSVIINRLKEGRFVLIAEIGVNYYDIAKVRGISNMDAAKLMVKEAKEARRRRITGILPRSRQGRSMSFFRSSMPSDMRNTENLRNTVTG